MLFSVEYDEDKRAIEIHLDEDGKRPGIIAT